jgi:hypothetical protein
MYFYVRFFTHGLMLFFIFCFGLWFVVVCKWIILFFWKWCIIRVIFIICDGVSKMLVVALRWECMTKFIMFFWGHLINANGGGKLKRPPFHLDYSLFSCYILFGFWIDHHMGFMGHLLNVGIVQYHIQTPTFI